MRGNGISLPAAYVVAAAVLTCFAAGYAAISKRVAGDGPFYLFAARALGKRIGIATAYVATVARRCHIGTAFAREGAHV